MNNESVNNVDTRYLKSGQIRLRFKLSEWAYGITNIALSLTEYKFKNSSLEAISLSYIAGSPSPLSLDHPAQGSRRFLVKLYPDQYEVVREALNSARQFVNSDAEALNLIGLSFLAESNENI